MKRMADLNELSTIIEGGIPSDPIDLNEFIHSLDVAIGVAQAALKQTDIDPNKYKEILQKGQSWAVLKLQAELELKYYIDETPSGPGRPTKTIIPDFKVRNKSEIIKLLELTERQQRDIRKLTLDGVNKAIEKAEKEGEIPTRYSAIKYSVPSKEPSTIPTKAEPDDEPVKDELISYKSLEEIEDAGVDFLVFTKDADFEKIKPKLKPDNRHFMVQCESKQIPEVIKTFEGDTYAGLAIIGKPEGLYDCFLLFGEYTAVLDIIYSSIKTAVINICEPEWTNIYLRGK
jgi:hypothetical protein